MRRNSNILKNQEMRSGMALMMAIGFMVIVAGILATMLNMTAVTTKKTQHMYFKEQAQLLAKSATEFAILAISAHNKLGNTDCVQATTSNFPAVNPYFAVTTNIRYIGLPGAAGTCAGATNYVATPFAGTGSNIAPESDGTVLIDVYVRSIEANLNLNENIVYHRRTLQKP